MKTVRYLQGMGEPVGPGIRPGETRKVSDEEAERLFERGIAVEYTKDDKATQETIKGIKNADEEGFNEIVSSVVGEAERRGVSVDVAAPDAGNGEVEVPDDVVPGETPGWPVVNGVVVDLPDEVREELASKEIAVELRESGAVIQSETEEEGDVSDEEKAAKEAEADKAAAETAKDGGQSKGSSTATSAKAKKAEKRG